MDTYQVIRIALTVLTPVLTAGIGIVALMVGDWRERRTQAGSRKLAFDDASRQVAFASEWWNASKLVNDSPEAQQRAAEQAQRWLAEASTLVTRSEPPPVEKKATITLRRVLLACPLHRRSARILRAFYWLCLGLVAQNVSSALGSAFGRTDTLGVANYFSGGFIYGDVVAVATMMVFAMAFRFWSLHAEHSDAATADQSMTVRRALLLYRFRQSAAVIARIVFYLWIGLTVVVAVLVLVAVYDDPRLIPANLLALAVFVGWALGLRYWAVSLEGRAADASRVRWRPGRRPSPSTSAATASAAAATSAAAAAVPAPAPASRRTSR
jgi:hypothetical protein